MKKSNKFFLIVVLVLVLLFGVGQFFAPMTPSAINGPDGNNQVGSASSSASPTPTLPSVPPTQIVRFTPTQPATSTPSQTGSCWTNSIAAPFRADAWRCTVGNNIVDPCFQIPGSKNLLCGVNPTVQSSTKTFVLRLAKALPKSQPLQGLPPAEQVWLVKLANGTLCTPFEGTRPFTASGDSANYACAPGPLGTDVMIFGDLNASTSIWTARIGTLTTPTSSLPTFATSSTVPVVTVWQ